MSDSNLTSKEKLPDWLRRWYCLKGEPRFREAADEIERLQRELVKFQKANAELALSHTHEPPDVPAVTALDQYRCQPEKQVYCPHMDRAHLLLAEWLKAWDDGIDVSNTYRRTQELLQGVHLQAEPPGDVIRARSFWSPDHKELITAYVSVDDISLMDDDGDIYEPAGDEQTHGPTLTKEVRHAVTCKLFPDPHDEREPVGPCTCGAETKPACQCGHPFAPNHQTPGTECAVEDCPCGRYRASTETGDGR